MDYTALVSDFRLVMDEFRTNGRDSAVDEPPNTAAVLCGSASPRSTPPPEWERRGVLWSHQWRCSPGTPTVQQATSGLGGGQVYSRLYRAEGPFGSVLVVDPRPAGGGGGSPPARLARAGRATARKRNKQPNHCVFCKNNNELPCVYRSHILKDNQGRILCPILRVYTCPTCGANGDQAHTVKYCPQRQAADDQHVESQPLPGASLLIPTPLLPPPLLRPVGRPITKRTGCC